MRAVDSHGSTAVCGKKIALLLAVLTLLSANAFGMGQSALAAQVGGDGITLNDESQVGTGSETGAFFQTDEASADPQDTVDVLPAGSMGETATAEDSSSEVIASEESETLDSSINTEESSVDETATGDEAVDKADAAEVADAAELQAAADAPASATSGQMFAIDPQAAGVAPEVLFTEDFENGTASVPRALIGYTGTNGIKYTASVYWRDSKYCNGFITSATPILTIKQITNTYCGLNGDPTDNKRGDYDAVRTKAQALGTFANQMDGTVNDAQNNRALSTNTSGGTPDQQMFQSTTNTITLKNSADKRFFAFSVDAAVTYELGVAASKPEMYFSLVKNGQPPVKLYDTGAAIPGNTGGTFDLYQKTPVNSNLKWASQGSIGRYYSNSILLEGNQQIGILLENFSTASSTGCGAYAGGTGNPDGCTGNNANKMGTTDGNDGAIDNVRVVDVTPAMEKSFSPVKVRVGMTSTMTITVNNRSDGLKKNGWQFVDTLPAGLKFANSTVGGTCVSNGSTITANVGTGVLAVTNGILTKGQASCTITTTVTSNQATTFTNGGPNGNFSALVGIDPPGNAQVTFYPVLTLQKNIVSRQTTGDQFTLTITPGTSGIAGASATTTGATTGVQSNRIAGPVELVAGGLYTLRETGSNGANLANYQIALQCVDTVNGNSSVPVTPVTGTPGSYTLVGPAVPTGGSVNVVCTFTNQKMPEPKLTLVKVAANPAVGTGYAVATDWTLTATGSGTAAGTTASGATGTPTVTAVTVTAGSYGLSETFATNPSKSAGYTWTDVVCRDASNNVVTTNKNLNQGVVTSASVSLARGDAVTCTYTNTAKLGSVTWAKVGQGGASLSNSEWTLTGPGFTQGGGNVEDCTSGACAGLLDKDAVAGQFRLADLPWGSYSLEETKAPAGYQLLEDPVEFTIGADNALGLNVSLGQLINMPRDTPNLPFTGGIGRDFFFIIGAVVVIAGGGAAVKTQIRRSKGVALNL